MLNAVEHATTSYEQIDFSTLSLYETELLCLSGKNQGDQDLVAAAEAAQVDKLKPEHLGDELFGTLFKGISEKDPQQVAWAMAKISHSIHEYSEESEGQKRSHLTVYPQYKAADKFNTELSAAKEWVKGDRNTPLGFAVATLSQRIYLTADELIEVPIGDMAKYASNEKYYKSLLGLFDIDLDECKHQTGPSKEFEKQLANTKISFGFDDEMRLTDIKIAKLNKSK